MPCEWNGYFRYLFGRDWSDHCYGGATAGFSLSVDFQSFLVGGLILVLIGATLIPGLPAVAKLAATGFDNFVIVDLHSHNARFGVHAYAHLRCCGFRLLRPGLLSFLRK